MTLIPASGNMADIVGSSVCDSFSSKTSLAPGQFVSHRPPCSFSQRWGGVHPCTHSSRVRGSPALVQSVVAGTVRSPLAHLQRDGCVEPQHVCGAQRIGPRQWRRCWREIVERQVLSQVFLLAARTLVFGLTNVASSCWHRARHKWQTNITSDAAENFRKAQATWMVLFCTTQDSTWKPYILSWSHRCGES